jgi:hypothetical protein
LTAPARRERSQLDALRLRAVDLLLRPERFFRFGLRHHAEAATPILLIWLLGVNGTIDSIAARGVLGEATGRPGLLVSRQWSSVLPTALVGGIFAGFIGWWIRGWWFKVRLRLCGAREPSIDAARFIWLYATSAYAVPSLVSTLLTVPLYSDLGAFLDSTAVPLTSLGLMFWAVWVGYRGAVSCFSLGRLRAVLWFLVLPSLWFLAQVGGTLLAAFALR